MTTVPHSSNITVVMSNLDLYCKFIFSGSWTSPYNWTTTEDCSVT